MHSRYIDEDQHWALRQYPNGRSDGETPPSDQERYCPVPHPRTYGLIRRSDLGKIEPDGTVYCRCGSKMKLVTVSNDTVKPIVSNKMTCHCGEQNGQYQHFPGGQFFQCTGSNGSSYCSSSSSSHYLSYDDESDSSSCSSSSYIGSGSSSSCWSSSYIGNGSSSSSCYSSSRMNDDDSSSSSSCWVTSGCTLTFEARNGKPIGIPCGEITKTYRLHLHHKMTEMWGRNKSKSYHHLGRMLHMSKDDCHVAKFDAITCYNAMNLIDYWRALKCTKLPLDLRFMVIDYLADK